MPVQIGDQPDHGFDEPIALMRDCHRRIEKFIGVLLRVAADKQGASLDEPHREALAAALRYFRSAAPWHTSDEEESLFPRVRALGDVRLTDAIARIDALEADHERAEMLHDQVDTLGQRWLHEGRLPPAVASWMHALLVELRTMYERHIHIEDNQIFPLAEVTLSSKSRQAIGREMALRRGIEPGSGQRRCRHAKSGTNTPDIRSIDTT